jgi:signal transduction histidine kinase
MDAGFSQSHSMPVSGAIAASLLLVTADEPEAASIRRLLIGSGLSFNSTRCVAAEAGNHLSTGQFHVVVTGCSLSEDETTRLVGYVNGLNSLIPIVSTGDDAFVDRVRGAVSTRGAADEAAELTRALRDIRNQLARVAHDLNNPLAVISGNAQLLGELTRYAEADPMIVKPIQDIGEATEKLGLMLGQLNTLRQQASEALGEAPPVHLW